MSRPTLIRMLLQERHWDDWSVFRQRFEDKARELAVATGSPRLADVSVGRRTFDRWYSGRWYGRPWSDTRPVLEALLGFSCAELFSPAPDVMRVRPTVGDNTVTRAAASIQDRWPTSRLIVSADGATDTWELRGRSVLDGTSAAVQFRPVELRDGRVLVDANDGSLREFLRPARRGMLVGMSEAGNVPRLFVIDAANARAKLRCGAGRGDALALSTEHELDDLTYGIWWALAQLDDGLLSDDQAIDEETGIFDTYLSLPRSAPSRMSMPELSSVGSNWVGSAFCASHVERRLSDVPEPPVFWTREQTGEEAAAWLFFRHKTDYLRSQSERFGGASARTFCVPESTVADSERYERILLFLTIALMERYGVRVRVTPDTAYSNVDGFALVPGECAVVANWVRTEALWNAGVSSDRSALSGYREVLGDASGDDVLAGGDVETRLRELAAYLEIDWPWLVWRCRELAAYGTASVFRPRSRLVGLAALDEVLGFVGGLADGR